MASGDESSVDKLTELTDKMNRCNKNIKNMMDSLNTILERLNSNNNNKVENKNDDIEKDKLDKIFAKRQVGRPVGTWESKREQYANMLNEGKIKQPKEVTLEYYKIVKVGDKYVMIATDVNIY